MPLQRAQSARGHRSRSRPAPFLKAPGYRDGHAGYSDPYDEQQFIVDEVNALEQTPDWSSTAVIVTYDDSDGFYDHVYSGIHNPSNTSMVASPPGPQDFLSGPGLPARRPPGPSPAKPVAADTVPGCRSSSSPHGPSATTSITP